MMHVREMVPEDIPLLSDYWLKSEPEYLIGMGVDIARLPERDDFENALKGQLALPLEQRNAYCLIWELDGTAIGHTNTNPTHFGDHAFMHLHIWSSMNRGRGLGLQYLQLSIPIFFEKLNLDCLYCEPFALNPAPHRVIEKLGFEFQKEYITIPGSINFQQPVRRWLMTRKKAIEGWG